MTIRRAHSEDAESIAFIGAAVWLTTYATNGVSAPILGYVREEFALEKVVSEIGDPTRRFWILEAEDGPIGFCDVATDGDSAELARFYILEQFCGKGHGSSFLHRVSDELFIEGIQRIWLSVWFRNSRAIGFYRKCGWAHTSDTEFILDGVAHLNHVFEIQASPSMSR